MSMSFFKKLANLISPPGEAAENAYWITAKCNRCGESIRARVNLQNDLSPEYSDKGMTYFCRKTLIGQERCFQRLEVELIFDSDKRLANREITGGQFIDE